MERSELLQVLSGESLRLLDALPPYREADVLRTATRLRAAGHDAAQVAAVLTQARLRAKAQQKFGPFAHSMLFTEEGLQQATRLRVAATHAARFVGSGIRRVVDLGCGIGSDAMALAGAGLEVTAVEIDEVTAAIASYNLAPFPNAQVRHGRAEEVGLDAFDALWLDPARRTRGPVARRVRDPNAFSPPLSFALEKARTMPTGIKLGPGLDRTLIPDDTEAQWVSLDGTVVELVLWSYGLARDGVRRAALVLHGDDADELTAGEDAPDAASIAVGEFVYEPDGAVIRARQIGRLADALGAGMLAPGVAYLTSDHAAATPFAACFQVDEHLPYATSALAKALRTRGIGKLEIKKRGVDVDPAVLRRSLHLQGPHAAVLILTRDRGGTHLALLAHRVAAHAHPSL